jgi:ribosomal protein S18 acetylase RimI-like enzyme
MGTDTSRAYSIRRCSVADAETVAALGARLFAETYGPTHPEPELSRYLARAFSVDSVRDAIADEEVSMLMVENHQSVPIGYAYLRVSHEPPAGVTGNQAIEVVRFYVDTSYQGRGIGAALMEDCLDDAKARGADVVWLQTWKEAPWAVGFYARMGFVVVGSAPFYFGEQVGDDHIMAKALLG